MLHLENKYPLIIIVTIFVCIVHIVLNVLKFLNSFYSNETIQILLTLLQYISKIKNNVRNAHFYL